MRKKSTKIMNIRVLSILSVLIMHSIILYSPEWDLYHTEVENALFVLGHKSLSYFAMPLFFSMSGYLFFQSYGRYSIGRLISNKTKRLLVPFLVVGIGYMIPLRILFRYPAYENKRILQMIKDFLLINDSGHLWYLPALFIMLFGAKIILDICNRFKKIEKYSDIVLFIIAFILYFQGYKICFNIPSLLSCCAYLMYFSLGFVICKRTYILKCLNLKVIKVVLVMTIIFLGGMIFVSSRVLWVLSFKLVLIIAIYVLMPEKTNKYIEQIEGNSFGLYLFHSPLTYATYIWLLNGNPYIVLFINLVVCGTIAFCITKLLRRSRLRFVIGE